MLQRTICLALFVTIVAACSLDAAFLRNIQHNLVQPNGDTILCYISGDEFYHWLHDKDDFTIIKDPTTRYWVYAEQYDDKIVPSPHVLGKVSPYSTSLTPGLMISQKEYLDRRALFYGEHDISVHAAPTYGTINMVVILIRFNDQTEFLSPRSDQDDLYNDTSAGAVSVRNYFDEASYSLLTISSTLYPTVVPTSNLSYQDSHDSLYFSPFDPVDNPIGYSGSEERILREHTLLRDAINAVSSEIPADLDVDSDDDGEVDIVAFAIRGADDVWGDIRWPHKSDLTTHSMTINGAQVGAYTFVPESSLYCGTSCHEICHTLGAPDFYHCPTGDYSHLSPVYSWDLMGYPTGPPHMSAYAKERYMQWISIPTESGGLALQPLAMPTGTITNSARRINSPESVDEYYIVEYRYDWGTFEHILRGSGLLVYRINTNIDGEGNIDGPPDEIYVYRPGGTLTENGDPEDAAFRLGLGGLTTMNNYTDPKGFLSDGSNGDLFLADVGLPTSDNIYCFVTTDYQEIWGDVYDGSGGPLNMGDPYIKGFTYWANNEVVTPATETLTIVNGARLYGTEGVQLKAEGTIYCPGGTNWTRLFTLSRSRSGLQSKGEIRITNGGAIRFH